MGHSAIADASESILGLLREQITRRDDIDVDMGADEIVIASPDDVVDDSDVRLSLFPYKISRDSGHASTGRIQMGENSFRNPPLTLKAYYILTAYARDGETDPATRLQKQQTAIGLAMQVIHDNSVIDENDLSGALRGTRSLELTMHDDNEEIERVWNTFVDSSIRPSVIYEASPVQIESMTTEEVTRVSDREVDVDHKRNE